MKKEKFKVCINNPFDNCEYVYPIQQKKVAEMIDHLKEDNNVKKIILFGSSVTSKCHRDSDIDIYVEISYEKN